MKLLYFNLVYFQILLELLKQVFVLTILRQYGFLHISCFMPLLHKILLMQDFNCVEHLSFASFP